MAVEKPADDGQSSSSSELALPTIDTYWPMVTNWSRYQQLTVKMTKGDAGDNSSLSSESESSNHGRSILDEKKAKSGSLKVSAIAVTEKGTEVQSQSPTQNNWIPLATEMLRSEPAKLIF